MRWSLETLDIKSMVLSDLGEYLIQTEQNHSLQNANNLTVKGLIGRRVACEHLL